MRLKTAFLLAFSFIFFSPQAYAFEQAVLTAYDSLAKVDSRVQVEAKVEEDSFFPYRSDIEGARVGFFKNQTLVGMAETNRDGIAKLIVDTLGWPRGITSLQIRLLSPRNFRAKEQKLDVHLWREDQKIIITDIDQTLSQAKKWQVVGLPVEYQKPFDHAAETLRAFSKQGYKIFYLTAREDALIDLTRDWLAHHGFPHGVLKVWDLDFWGGTPWNHGQYKFEVIQDLKTQFSGIVAGFGDRPHDIQSYMRNDLPAYLLRSSSNADDTFPVGPIEYSSWAEIKELLATGKF